MRKNIFCHALTLILIFVINIGNAQSLSKQETLDYINNKIDYKISIDSLGNISINKNVKFLYKSISIIKNNDFEIEFRCKLNEGNCIYSNDLKKVFYTYKIKITKDGAINIFNAFDHLFKLLYKEKPELTNDPFSPSNYKR